MHIHELLRAAFAVLGIGQALGVIVLVAISVNRGALRDPLAISLFASALAAPIALLLASNDALTWPVGGALLAAAVLLTFVPLLGRNLVYGNSDEPAGRKVLARRSTDA